VPLTAQKNKALIWFEEKAHGQPAGRIKESRTKNTTEITVNKNKAAVKRGDIIKFGGKKKVGNGGVLPELQTAFTKHVGIVRGTGK